MSYNNRPMCLASLQDDLRSIHKDALIEMLVDIAASLAFDEDGICNPEESVAANSAADFVDSVTHTFFKMRIEFE